MHFNYEGQNEEKKISGGNIVGFLKNLLSYYGGKPYLMPFFHVVYHLDVFTISF